MDSSEFRKYLKYKKKYLQLKNQTGGTTKLVWNGTLFTPAMFGDYGPLYFYELLNRDQELKSIISQGTSVNEFVKKLPEAELDEYGIIRVNKEAYDPKKHLHIILSKNNKDYYFIYPQHKDVRDMVIRHVNEVIENAKKSILLNNNNEIQKNLVDYKNKIEKDIIDKTNLETFNNMYRIAKSM
ncbi:hypothetical protein Indivirus_2_120 [Indivirus ILV1]|uniref:Uncharacterized protein n=1 Tax=Indivirus ILV1 TaxID=1977633 RepID=A0A1V0SDH2_9VIRU|nr:hypothetical protein Indivirus_2_120 [Indivirus ILV1]